MGFTGSGGSSGSWIGPALKLGGALYSASAARNAGQSANLIYQLQANEKLKEADQLKKRSKLKQERFRGKTRRFIGAQHAIMAHQGVDSNQGSALDVLSNMAGEAELDALLIGYEGDLGAMKAKKEAELLKNQGNIVLQNAKSKSTSELITGFGSLLEDLPKYDYRRKVKKYPGVGSYGVPQNRYGREAGIWH